MWAASLVGAAGGERRLAAGGVREGHRAAVLAESDHLRSGSG